MNKQSEYEGDIKTNSSAEFSADELYNVPLYKIVGGRHTTVAITSIPVATAIGGDK